MTKGRLLALLLVSITLPAFAHAERIVSFTTVIDVKPDSSIGVVENIQYDFEGAERHGIFRDIPANIQNVSVVDELGKPYTFSISKNNGQEELKIGDASTLISGIHTYKITYSVSDAVTHYQNFDEIYWNATGNAWQVPIGEAEAQVVLPTPVSNPRIACYYGPQGSTASCDSVPNVTEAGLTKLANFQARNLNAYEGLTVAVGFPKGIVTEPSTAQKVLNFIKDNPILFLPVIVFIVMFALWWKKGRDPRGSGVVIAEYDAPDGLTPLECAGILSTTIPSKAFSAEIVYLATRGYLKIDRLEEKVMFFKETDYKLTLLKDFAGVVNAFDLGLLQALFENGAAGAEVKLSDLKNKFYTHIGGIKSGVYQSLKDKGYYNDTPNVAISKYSTKIFALLLLAIIIMAYIGQTSLVSVLSLIASLVICAGFAAIMPSVTEKGAKAKDAILGLKEYLQIAEKDRLEFHDAPEKRPEVFEKLLPYAMVLGVEKAWAKEFADIYTTPPSWYSDPYSTGAFNTFIFTQSLGSFSTAASASLASSPGGGSGGGGFSGGGGGGGGGGSW